MKILVTGATGNVGSEVVGKLKNRDCDIRLGLRNTNDVIGDEVEKVWFDFAHPDSFKEAFQDIQKIFLMRPPAISNVKEYLYPAIDAAKKSGVEHIVFLSLQGAESNSMVPHHKVEKYIKKSGVSWTFLRPSFFMQNLNTTHQEEIRDQNKIFVPAGKGKTSFIDVRNIAAVAALVLTEDGHQYKAYELTGTKPLSYYEVAEAFSKVLNRSIRYAKPSIPRFAWRMMKRGEKLKFIVVMIVLYSTVRFGYAEETTNAVKQLLGRPPISLEEYIEDYRKCWV